MGNDKENDYLCTAKRIAHIKGVFMEINNSRTLELGTKPIGPLLRQYAVPAIIAMIATSLYNIVDRIFIGQGVGPMAISGLAITFPFMNLSGAFGAAVGVGSSTLISVNLGRKNYRRAQLIFGSNITLNIVLGIVFGVGCLIFLDPILRTFGATEQTLPYAREYMQILLGGNAVTHLYLGMNAVLRSASMPRMAMGLTICTVIINTILDPLFIYVFHWGIRGAAIATILAQTFAMCWQLFIFADKTKILHHERGIYRLRWDIVKGIVGIGLSPFCMNTCACLVVIFINNALVHHGGDFAVGAYGISNSIVFIFIMITIGLTQGMQPIAGYNYGANNFSRMMHVVRLTMITATVITSIGWLVAELLTTPCVTLFTSDPELTAISARGLRINAILMPIIGYQMVVTNFFQSIGKAKLSIFLSLSRQLIFLIPAIVILSNIWGTDGVWASLPTSDLLATVVAAVCMNVYMRRLRHHEESMGEQELQSYNYYQSSNGAAPRGMAPQASGSLYERVNKGEENKDEE